MESSLILVRILIAHLITDFILQPKKWVSEKREKNIKSTSLYFHVLLTGIAAYIFIADWSNFLFPVYITVTHFFIDLWKSYKQDNIIYFIIDQFFHIVIIISGWWIFIIKDTEILTFIGLFFNNYSIMIITMSYIIIIWPLDYLIKLATDPWRLEINPSETDNIGLKDAGKWIGKLERVLILTFILMNNLGAIGFLIAAKSIFRFGEIKEKKDRKEAEYILIGTLLSFASAILVGSLISTVL